MGHNQLICFPDITVTLWEVVIETILLCKKCTKNTYARFGSSNSFFFPPWLLSHSQYIRFPRPNIFHIKAGETNAASHRGLGNRMSPRCHVFPTSGYQEILQPSPKLGSEFCPCVFHVLGECVSPFRSLLLFSPVCWGKQCVRIVPLKAVVS